MARYPSLLTILLIALMAIIVRPAVSLAQWVEDGVPICTATGTQWFPQLVSDGVGGAIITWEDERDGDWDIYAQRVDSSGAVLWITDGVEICMATLGQRLPQLVSDGAGGAIITWYDYRSGSTDIYAQRVDSSGTVLWTTDGVEICTAMWYQDRPQLVADGVGGAIITWEDRRNLNPDIYAQRVDSSGTVLWTADGVAICTATSFQGCPELLTDGGGGAIITWEDKRNGHYDIYAQGVNSSGITQWAANGVAICTAASSQYFPLLVSDGAGGAIITWQDERSGYYDVYAQKVDASGTVQWTTDGVAICTATGSQWHPQLVSDGVGGAIIAWGGSDIQSQGVDASGTVLWDTNGVEICTAWDEQWAYPRLVSDGVGGAIITWPDYRDGYAHIDIYIQRVDTSGTVLWDTNGVAICRATGNQENPQLVSDGVGGAIITWEDYRSGHCDIYAQRVDHEGHAPPTGVPYNGQAPELPQLFSLSQNYPNPFNSTTLIRYHLPAVSSQLSAISLKIYNILGEEVRTLVEKEQVSGYYSVIWDGRDSLGKEVSSGIYLYRLEAGEFRDVRRMVLLR